jgi:hypothetical protein
MTSAVQACGIYARISSDDGSPLGVARQIEHRTREAERRRWPVAQVFTDNDVSGSHSAKPCTVQLEAECILQLVQCPLSDR